MRVRILSDCRAEGRHLTIGEVVELSQFVASELMAIGRAEIAPEPEIEPVPEPKPRRTKTSITSTPITED
jgi:hypothetical protein